MATFYDHTATINLKFLKQFGFYQMFDPTSKKIFGWNFYQLSFVVLTAITQCIVCFGNCGFLFELEDTVNNFDLFMIIFCNLLIYFNVWKVFKLIFNRKEILDLLEVTDFMFLKSKQCRHNIKILYKHRNRAFKFTNLYFILWIILMIQWLIFPIMINSFIVYKADNNRRLVNIINWQYTVDVNTYNKYYVLFYVFELILAIKTMYLLVISDVLLLSIGWAVVVQYEVLAVAFKNIGLDENFQKDHDHDVLDDYKCFKSILFDQQKLDLKLKLYFSIVKHIVLIYVANISGLIIILLNSFVMVFLSTEPFTYSIVKICRIGSSILFGCLQLFLYCHLFDNINLKREFVNLGVYSCNWTKMDFKFKKLLLLTMQVNDVNRNTTMKLSPKKLVNLQIFANVLTTSYNIVSVMVKSMNK